MEKKEEALIQKNVERLTRHGCHLVKGIERFILIGQIADLESTNTLFQTRYMTHAR